MFITLKRNSSSSSIFNTAYLPLFKFFQLPYVDNLELGVINSALRNFQLLFYLSAQTVLYPFKKFFRIESQPVELTQHNLQTFRDYLNRYPGYYHAEVFGEFTNSLRSLFLYQDASYQFYSN